MKKLLAGGTLAVLAFGGMIAGAAPASAHIPNANAECGVVNVDFRSYQDTTIDVVIDGVSVESTQFRGDFIKQYPISLDAAHEWSVTVDAHDDDQFDYTNSGSLEVCEAPPIEPEPTEPPVTEPPVTEEPSVEPTTEPTDEASVAPVAEEPSASPSPVAEDEPEVLAATGATVGGAIAFAALLAAGGIALVWARRRMQNA